jgi:hypothetical protein
MFYAQNNVRECHLLFIGRHIISGNHQEINSNRQIISANVMQKQDLV